MQRKLTRLSLGGGGKSTRTSIKQPVGRTRDKAETFAILHALFRSDLDSKASRPALYSASPDAAAATTAAAAATTAEETLRRELSLLCSADRDDIITCDVPGGDSKGLGSPPLRGVRWRVLLGALSRDCRSWACDVADQRGEYARWRSQFLVDLRAAAAAASGAAALGFQQQQQQQQPQLNVLNPLSQAEDSPWNRFFKTSQLQKEINEDVIRTYPDLEFFLRKDVREVMNRVLFVFAMLHPQLRYVQGMNEIVAPLVYVLYGDYLRVCELLGVPPAPAIPTASHEPRAASASPTPAPSIDEIGPSELRMIVTEATRIEFIEHDAYRLFSQLMLTIGDWFLSPKIHIPSSPDVKPGHISSALKTIELVKVVSKCLSIQSLLTAKDPDLAGYLSQLDIQPQLYMLRWVRILFSQVFPLDDLLPLWDAIFAVGPPFLLIDHLCVTLLTLVRVNIIGEDYASVLDLLFHYPRTLNTPSLIVSIALNSLKSVSVPYFLPTGLWPPMLQTPILITTLTAVASPPVPQPPLHGLPPAPTVPAPTPPTTLSPPVPHPPATKSPGQSRAAKGHARMFSAQPSPPVPALRPDKEKEKEKDWTSSRQRFLSLIPGTSSTQIQQSPQPLHPLRRPSGRTSPPTVVSQLSKAPTAEADMELEDTRTMPTEGSPTSLELRDRISAMQATNMHVTSRLDRVIFMLNALMPTVGAQNTANFHIAVTELEQIRSMITSQTAAVAASSSSSSPLLSSTSVSPGPGIRVDHDADSDH